MKNLVNVLWPIPTVRTNQHSLEARDRALARAFIGASIPRLLSHHSTVAFNRLRDRAYPDFVFTSEGSRR